MADLGTARTVRDRNGPPNAASGGARTDRTWPTRDPHRPQGGPQHSGPPKSGTARRTDRPYVANLSTARPVRDRNGPPKSRTARRTDRPHTAGLGAASAGPATAARRRIARRRVV
ncbi:hypothetical protein BBN63_13680 [Streptomyces niveus]|uniref:Uncharacterized protein n=1 Tax=Streptomyces niveus TaxID=193462 RepID=A0A1U9QSB7_STRNV|nr:hypothetical protein BBN63_13680 [Streptomyces niveus]